MQILFLRITLFQQHSKEKGVGGTMVCGCEFVFTIIEILCIPEWLTNFILLEQLYFFFFQIAIRHLKKIYSENCHKWNNLDFFQCFCILS